MQTDPDGAPIQDDRPPTLRLRVEALSLQRESHPATGAAETVEAHAEAVDDASGLVECTDAGGQRRRCLVRGVTVVVDTREPFVFGRRSVAALRLGLVFASQKHAVLHWYRDEATLEDPGSTNGTFVNGNRIQRVRLRHGDLVHFESHGTSRLMCRVLMEERPVLQGACRHDGWVILDGTTTVTGCHHRAFRRIDADTIETGTAVATGPVERFATPSRLAPATGFRFTADGAGIPAARLLELLRTGRVDDDLKTAIDALAADDTLDDTIDVDGRCFRWTWDHGVVVPMSRLEQAAVAAAVAGLLPRLVERHRSLVAELELMNDDDVAAVPLFVAPPDR